jgi:hypothetical protein
MSVSDRLGGFIFPGYDPTKVANAPTLSSVTTVNGDAQLAFTAPADTGGGAITSYMGLARNTSTGAYITGTSTSSPVTLSSTGYGTEYEFSVVAVNAYGPSVESNSITDTPVNIGQQAYTTSGSYSWVCPAGVTSVSVVAVGGGGEAGQSYNVDAGAGGGGHHLMQ